MKNKIVAVLCISIISTMLIMTGCSSSEQKKEPTQKTEDVKGKDEKKTVDETVKNNAQETSGESTKEESEKNEINGTQSSEIQENSGESANKSTDENEEIQDNTTQNQTSNIVGEWSLDWEATNANNEKPVRTEFGSGITEGNNITFNDDGSFSWYLGIGNGGKGTYVEDDGNIAGTYTSDTDGTQQEITMTLSDDEIVMDIWGDNSYSVYWEKN